MNIQITGVVAHIDTGAILKARGLGASNAAIKKLCSAAARFADKRVPMQSGTLKNSKKIVLSGAGNGYIVYPGPYAHYQHEGKVMDGIAPKHYTGQALIYHGAPARGSHWIDRTMQEDGDKIIAAFAKSVGGKPG